MYLGMVLLLAGIAIALGSATPWVVLPVFGWRITQRFIVFEEHKLEANFGPLYLAYKAKVRRWL
jgi:protein-S-isoprenylcysteine O-methyltransferase Ste14